ncbi:MULTISPECIES: hypothetical protein [Nostocales]|uniref:Uncharacterized protein n=1 Tax=Dolichospermum flos-aquae UHCC 0037 TaxID=2590026 RepID=A0ACC7SB55_DOLFA|nr:MULTISPECIES: hypothetical protein [Nostocales]MBO1064964.1 hypothetical protein [Anabaena sp. 54]MTJ45758.1 hypothetical protein [Dolichospermum flos-aquae UHCC 0037]
MSNLLFTTLPIEQQETIIGGVADVNLGDLNKINAQGKNNIIAIQNNITVINMIFNFFIYPPFQNRKYRRCKF